MSSHLQLHNPALMYPWEKRTLFIGRLPEPLYAAYGAATLLISLGKSITVRVNGRTLQCGSFLIPAGIQVGIDAGIETVALLHLDVLGDDARRLQGGFAHEGSGVVVPHGLHVEEDLRYLLGGTYRQPMASAHLYDLLDATLEYGVAQIGQASTVDPQVQATVNFIKQNFQDNIPIDELARRVHVSTPTLIRKFKQQAGVPIRRFRLWHRIYESMIFISAGQNLTDAAINAGFTDSSHYTHTLRTMWGVSPSCLFNREIRAEIIPPVK
jgi:AraC-like DNA-binding protein